MVPCILFSDDMSGNRSKKWHKFESWFLSLAGLPRHLNARLENIHFVSCSDSVSPLDLVLSQVRYCCVGGCLFIWHWCYAAPETA